MIINVTQHSATAEQLAQGVVDLPEEVRECLSAALTFAGLPDAGEIEARAAIIAELAVQNGLGGDDGDDPTPASAMIGGAPYLMAPLERALRAVGIEPIYAFSTRASVEQHQPDGSVRKVMVFRHAGFVAAAE